LVETAELIEGWIIAKEAKPAFPVNISINENAAHYTPSIDEQTVFGEKNVIKIDIGTHVDGFIGDIAYTIDLSGENGKLIEASQEALNNALSIIKAGAETWKIGEVVEETIKKFGFKPIENLSGHMLKQYDLHAGISIPNIKTMHSYELEEGMVLAIEPFASTGNGRITESRRTDIFCYEKDILTRNKDAREMLSFVKNEYKTLHFAERWLAKKYDKFKLSIALRELSSREALLSFPVLHDVAGSLVSQAEVTVIVEKDSCKVLTK
jgi:methionyl aminopeptidase